MKASTSLAAYHSISMTELEERVLEVIEASGMDGCISDEVQACYPKLSYSSVTARFSSLEKKGLIYRNGDTRPGVSGRQQQVMRLGKYKGMVPVVRPPKPVKVKRSGFLNGLMYAARLMLAAPDLEEAKRQMKKEILKAAKR